MIRPIVLTETSEIIGQPCLFDKEKFVPGQHALQCPECERWYHPGCWHENENACSILGCKGRGEVGEPLPLPEEPPEFGLEIEITEAVADSTPVDEPNIAELLEEWDGPQDPQPLPEIPSPFLDRLGSNISRTADLDIDIVPTSMDPDVTWPEPVSEPIDPDFTISDWDLRFGKVAKRVGLGRVVKAASVGSSNFRILALLSGLAIVALIALILVIVIAATS